MPDAATGGILMQFLLVCPSPSGLVSCYCQLARAELVSRRVRDRARGVQQSAVCSVSSPDLIPSSAPAMAGPRAPGRGRAAEVTRHAPEVTLP